MSLSTNNARDGGMYAYIGVNGATLPGAGVVPVAAAETYYCVAGVTLDVTDPSKGVLANDTGANGAVLSGSPTLVSGSLQFRANGTFTYTQAPTDTDCGGTFTYQVNGTISQTATIARCDAGSFSAPGCVLTAGPTAANDSFSSNITTRLQVSVPGVLGNDTDPDNKPLAAVPSGSPVNLSLSLNPDGSFIATPTGAGTAVCPVGSPAGSECYTFSYQARNAQGSLSGTATATLTFKPGSGLVVNVKDGKTNAASRRRTTAGSSRKTAPSTSIPVQVISAR